MNRNRNVDILRCLAILIIIVYHAYVVCGYPWVNHNLIHTLISFGGELGVTLFFALSGYGIYVSLYRKEIADTFPSWWTFIKGRCKRIMPPYYVCLGLLLVFQSANLLSKTGLKHILAYITFTQNLFVETHGSINGALWTMATMFQFYLIAIVLFKCVRKNAWVAGICSVIVTIASKYIVFNFLIPANEAAGSFYFVYGRQLITALDNFVLGMVAGEITLVVLPKLKKSKNRYWGLIMSGVAVVVIGIASYYYCKKGIYGCSINGYTGHSVLAVLFAVAIISAAMAPSISGLFEKGIRFLTEVQYTTYLWHMPIITCLYANSVGFNNIAHTNFALFAIAMMAIAIIVGTIMGKVKFD